MMPLPPIQPPLPPVLPTLPAIVSPDDSREVVVTVDAAGWHAKYKGQRTTFARALTAAEVERLAGEWGRGVDAPKPAPLLPRLFDPPVVPAVFPVYRSGGT